jgi:hypothetical protein
MDRRYARKFNEENGKSVGGGLKWMGSTEERGIWY